MRFLLCWLILFSLAGSTTARDLFVRNVGGDDRQNGFRPDTKIQGAGPVRTIRRALELASQGDRVILINTGEPYRECVTLQGPRHNGSQSRPFQLIGNGATLDGSFVVPPDAWAHEEGDVFRFEPRLKSYHQLFLANRPLEHVDTTDRSLTVLEPMQWSLRDGKIYFRPEEGRLPQSYELSYTGHTVGITMYNVRNVVVTDLIVQGFQLDGINAHDNVSSATVQGVVCRGNGRSGISVGGASRVRVESSLVGDNGAAQVRTEGYCKTWLVDCELLDNTAPKIKREGGRVYVETSPRADE